MTKDTIFDVMVIGAGPAGVVAALRAGDLGAKTVLVTRDKFGGMAANDGPVPVRTLAHAARLMRETRQLREYGIEVSNWNLDYQQLLSRVREVVNDVSTHSFFRKQINALNVTIYEQVGDVSFIDLHTIETQTKLRLSANNFILCTGGISRRLSVPGFEYTATPSAAWSLSAVPASMLVIGAGATGVQVASIFQAFGTRIQLYQTGPRILPTEDEAISAEVTAYFRQSGMLIRENFGDINSFEKTKTGIRMTFSKEGIKDTAEAELAVIAVGWQANTTHLNLERLGVELDTRGFIKTNSYLQTSAPHIYAAGDITGRLMLVPQAIKEGFMAATNAVHNNSMPFENQVSPIGSFTDPEYAQVGLTENKARETYDITTAVIRFDTTTRNIIDGRTYGLCKLIVDRKTYKILGCHVVGERAVEIVQTAAIAMTAGMRVNDLAQIPFSFPTYTAVLGRASAIAARELNLQMKWQPHFPNP